MVGTHTPENSPSACVASDVAVAVFLALGANFVGITSALLGLLPPSALNDLDVVYPVRWVLITQHAK
jgi:hypothetical protein